MNRTSSTVLEADAPTTTGLQRRAFLRGAAAAVIAGGAVAATADDAFAQSADGTGGTCSDDCETMTVWRLSSDWGYARGPHGKTRLESKASLNAAKYRWALTEQDALDMNLHKCSWAPAVPVTVNKCAFMEVWDHNGNGAYDWSNPWKDIDVRIFDERCLPHIDNGDVLWEKALNPTCSATSASTALTNVSGGGATSFTAGSTGSSGGSSSAGFVGSTAASQNRAGSSAASAGSDVQSALAYTGSSTRTLAAAGGAMVAGGAALTALAARKRKVAAAEG